MTLAHTFLRAQADRARERGDFATAFTAERDGFLFATHCRNNAASIAEFLVGELGKLSCRRMTLLANEDGVSDELLTTVAELLKDDFDENALFEKTVKREYAYCCRGLDKVGDTICIDELPEGLCTVCYLPGSTRILGFARFAYNKEMTRQDFVNVYRSGLAGRDTDELVPQPRSFLQPNFVGRLVVRIATPAFKDIRCHLKESLFALRAARTAVAIRRYDRANGGAIPSDLSALVPTYLAEVPRDPFSPDRALGYDATTRQLWTVGPDGDFNALDSAQTAKSGFRRKRAKCAFLLDGKRIER